MPEFIREQIERHGATRSAMIALVGVITLVAIYGLSRWATAPVWVPIMPGMTVDDVAVVSAALDEHSIRYQLSGGGAQVRVTEQDLPRARVVLAQAGATPSRGEPGFELFDQPSWGMTDFTQRINYRRALEGELERTIARMQGIESAQVHLAINETSAFRSAQAPAGASVVITLRSGARPGADLVEGVTSLVASSVGNLSTDAVTVLDQQGRPLSGASDGSSLAGSTTKRQLALRREVESYLEQRAEDLVGQVVGPGNARVRIAAEVNFDRVDRTTQKVNPDDQIATRQERTEITPAEGQIAASSSAISSEFETSRTVETFSGAVGDVRRLTVAVLLNERTDSAGGLQPAALTQQIEALVSNAVGLRLERGDAISVMAVPFGVSAPILPVAPAPNIIERVVPFQRPLIALVAMAVAAFIALRALATLRLRAPQQATLPIELEPATIPDAMPAARRVLQTAPRVEDPEMAARVLRAWIRE